MIEKKAKIPLTTDQEQQVSDTLKRIRLGLQIPINSQFEEPAHIFIPGGFNATE